jgi:hypothetical protein
MQYGFVTLQDKFDVAMLKIFRAQVPARSRHVPTTIFEAGDQDDGHELVNSNVPVPRSVLTMVLQPGHRHARHSHEGQLRPLLPDTSCQHHRNNGVIYPDLQALAVA